VFVLIGRGMKELASEEPRGAFAGREPAAKRQFRRIPRCSRISNAWGWVSVGVDHDTAAFAVNSIRQWWLAVGRARYPQATRLMITADGGGSNGSRVRLWKRELQTLANELGLDITVSHLPPGTSKWNKIEHRLFSFISQNWRAKPLVSYRVIVELISATTTNTGLAVRCQLDTAQYPKGIVVSDAEMAAINIKRHAFHGEWNYRQIPILQIAR